MGAARWPRPVVREEARDLLDGDGGGPTEPQGRDWPYLIVVAAVLGLCVIALILMYGVWPFLALGIGVLMVLIVAGGTLLAARE